MPASITGDRLTTLFRPGSVALVGASDKSVFSMIAYANLVRFGFGARTYLVNRHGGVIHGQPAFTSCARIGEPVDVAFLMVPQAGTLDALSDAAAAGIRNAVVLSSGYGEAGEAGKAAEAELAAHADSLGMILLGPNHLGFANFAEGIPVCSIPGLPEAAGPVALLSQSGASSAAMVDFATMANVGLSYLVTLGNEAMITAGHVLDFLVDDPGTRAVAIFMETVRDPQVFRRAARRAAQAGKAIVVLKAGSSDLSARTAAAHTGALVGDDRVIDAVFADLGVIRVDSIEDMLITAGAAAALGRLDRPGIGIVSISGGACDIVADRADDLGAQLPELAAPTVEALAAIMPDYGTVQSRRASRRLHQPGHAAGDRLHPRGDGPRRRGLRHPGAAPGHGGAAQRRLVVGRHQAHRRRDGHRHTRKSTTGDSSPGRPAPRPVVRTSRARAARRGRRAHGACPPRPHRGRGGHSGRGARRAGMPQGRLRADRAQDRHRRGPA